MLSTSDIPARSVSPTLEGRDVMQRGFAHCRPKTMQ